MNAVISARTAESVKTYIGLGSNLDGPQAHVRQALSELESLPQSSIVARSSLYANPPMGPQDQPDYVNAVVSLMTRLAAEELLDALQEIEKHHGRTRGAGSVHWGPRPLDLDILLYGDVEIDSARLKVPHPGAAERVFVLLPLHEIEPTLRIPPHGTVEALLGSVDASALIRLD